MLHTAESSVGFSLHHDGEIGRVPFFSRRAQLKLSHREIEKLTALSQSRSQPAGRVQRAAILLQYHAGKTISEIARGLGTNRPRVERCVSKALDLGVTQALAELPGRGRRPAITAEARAWVVSLACQEPNDLGYAQQLWTTRLLASHIRRHCAAAGHPSLGKLGRGTVSKILRAKYEGRSWLAAYARLAFHLPTRTVR